MKPFGRHPPSSVSDLAASDIGRIFVIEHGTAKVACMKEGRSDGMAIEDAAYVKSDLSNTSEDPVT